MLLKKTYKSLLYVSIPLLILPIGFLAWFHVINNAIVLKNSVANVGPSKLAAQALHLREGEKVIVINYFEEWYKVKTYGGMEAWLPVSEATSINE